MPIKSAVNVKKKNPAIFLPLPMILFWFMVLLRSKGMSVLMNVKATYVSMLASRTGR